MFEFLDDKEFAIEMRLESARVILQIQAEESDALTKQLEYNRSNKACAVETYVAFKGWDYEQSNRTTC